jgi:hypothetical protein
MKIRTNAVGPKTLNHLSICLAAAFISVATPTVPAQEIGHIDLTDPPYRDSLRHPPRTLAGGCAGGDSVTRQVTVTLQPLDKTIYGLGEEMTFEVGIQNTGKETILVPWTPDLADMEPTDPKAAYRYLTGVVILVFKDSKDRIFTLSESLYGSPNVPGTVRELPRGQSFTFRGRAKIENLWPRDWGKEELTESGAVGAKVSGHFREDNANYSPNGGGTLTESCIPMRSTKANECEVTVEFH